MNETITKALRNVTYQNENLKELEQLQENPVLYAQSDGIITSINYKEGEQIVATNPLFLIGDMKQTIMTLAVDPSDIGNIDIGQKVNVIVEAFAEETFTATVLERFLVANDEGDYEVTLTIDQSDIMLLPGMKAYATIIVKEKPNILTLSNKAIFIEDGKQYATIKNEEGLLIKTEITTGFSDGRLTEILAGLNENDIVYVEE